MKNNFKKWFYLWNSDECAVVAGIYSDSSEAYIDLDKDEYKHCEVREILLNEKCWVDTNNPNQVPFIILNNQNDKIEIHCMNNLVHIYEMIGCEFGDNTSISTYEERPFYELMTLEYFKKKYIIQKKIIVTAEGETIWLQ